MEKQLTMNLERIEAQEVEWLWYPYIPRGKLTILQGDPGEGKTMILVGIISALSKGAPIFNQALGSEPASTIYQTAEDGLADTIKPRLLAADADCSKVFVICENDNDYLTFTDDRIEQAIRETGAKLFILDPWQAFLGDNVDMHRANSVRPAFRKLSDVAARTGCAILLVGHMNKMQGVKGMYRGLGSIDIAGSARSILLVSRPQKNKEEVYLAQIKSNLAEKGPCVVFTIEDMKAIFRGTSELDAEKLLNGESGTVEPRSSKTIQAIEKLQELFEEGDEILSKEIYELFAEMDISHRTVDIAKQELGIRSVKQGDRWYWSGRK